MAMGLEKQDGTKVNGNPADANLSVFFRQA
jgi:hypothetical protein